MNGSTTNLATKTNYGLSTGTWYTVKLDSTNANLSVTLYHNYYEDMQDRMPRLRAENVHVYNIVRRIPLKGIRFFTYYPDPGWDKKGINVNVKVP